MNSLLKNNPKYPIDEVCYEVIDSPILQEILSCLQMYSMKCRKNIRVEIKEQKRSS